MSMPFIPLFTACTKEDLDMTPPSILIRMGEVDISGGKQMRVESTQLLIGKDIVATWSDDKTEICKAAITVAGSPVQSGAMLTNA